MYAMELEILGDPEMLYTLKRVYRGNSDPNELFIKRHDQYILFNAAQQVTTIFL
jgi:hypothetical protein